VLLLKIFVIASDKTSVGMYDRIAAEVYGEWCKSTEFSHIYCIIYPSGCVICAQKLFPTQITTTHGTAVI
jgi:hypothetical protein